MDAPTLYRRKTVSAPGAGLPKRYRMAGLAILALGLLLLFRHLMYDHNIFRYLCIGATLWFSAAGLLAGRGWLRRSCAVLAIIAAMTGILDLATLLLLRQGDSEIVSTVEPAGVSMFVRDPALGYTARPDEAFHVQERVGKSVTFDVHYDIGLDGRRLTPTSTGNAGGSVVFVGCSHTFGAGVNDDESLPAVFAKALGNVSVINAGQLGYGMHQVLRQIQLGTVTPAPGPGRRAVIYTAIPHHLVRLAGLADWDVWGPRYVLQDGKPLYVGPFHSVLGGLLLTLGRRSAMFNLVYNAWLQRAAMAAMHQPELWAAMVQEAARITRERDHADFIVVLEDDQVTPDPWDEASAMRGMEAALDRRGIPYIRVTDMIPDAAAHYKEDHFPFDFHPTPLMYSRMGRALARMY